MTVLRERENWIDKLYPEPYVVMNNQLYMEYERKEEMHMRKLCNFVPYLNSEVVLDDGIEKQRFIRVECVHASGAKLQEIELPASDLTSISLKWVVKHWGAKCNMEPGYNAREYIRHAIQSTARDIQTEVLYNHFGWRKIQGKWHFLMNNQGFKVKSEGALENYKFKILPENKSLEAASKLLTENGIEDNVIFPLISFAFMAPLNHFLKKAGCEPKSVMCLIGKTGTKKSTLAALILSFFGDFTNTDLPLSFRDTANSIVENAFSLKDVLTVIDDYHPSTKNEEQKMNSTAQTIMRAYGDRVGRNKLRSDSTLRIGKPPRGNALITGEQPPDITESGAARTIQLELTDNSIDINSLSEMQGLASAGYLSSAMYHYLKWLSMIKLDDDENFVKSLREDFYINRSTFIDNLNRDGIEFHPRLPETGAHLQIGFSYLLEFLIYKGVFDLQKYNELLIKGRNIIYDVIKNQAIFVKRDKPSLKFVAKVRSLLDSGKAIVEDLSSPSDNKPDGFVGYADSDYYYFVTDVIHSMVKKLCDEQNELFTASTKTLLKQLKEDGYLSTTDERSTTVVKVAGQSKRLMKIPRQIIDYT